MRVAIVSEFYPRAHDPVLGIWAHRQAVAARDAGAEVRVIVLYRPVPPRATAPRDVPAALRTLTSQPARAELDGLQIRYVPFVSPPRPATYGTWGAWAAPTLAVALRRLRRAFAFDLVHAHNAVPAADAVLRTRSRVPLVISVHGGDVYYTAPRHARGAAAVRRAYTRARLVLANSAGVEAAARELGAAHARVLHLGTDIPRHAISQTRTPTIVTVGHLVARKRHADVIRALWVLRDRHPSARYLIIGDGPERATLERLAADLGLADRVEFAGQLAREEAMARARTGHVFAMPSVDEAFGVAYVEAMAGGLPAVGALGEAGPQEIAAAGEGMLLVAPADVEALSGRLDALLSDPDARERLGRHARETVQRAFTWEACGRATVAAYEEALR